MLAMGLQKHSSITVARCRRDSSFEWLFAGWIMTRPLGGVNCALGNDH
jgi:hypothetical protein